MADFPIQEGNESIDDEQSLSQRSLFVVSHEGFIFVLIEISVSGATRIEEGLTVSERNPETVIILFVHFLHLKSSSSDRGRRHESIVDGP
jgi:hypothetical protein